ncbi:MAG: hydrogenase maturation protease [Solirubrobacterales bacterium]|nr:hydrogenase maturation protease [Solirubrobacterales bacterium]
MPDDGPAAVLVVGLGNELRRDDGAGIMVARDLIARGTGPGIEVRELPGEPIALLDAWQACDAAVVIDAMCSGAVPGTITRLDAQCEPLHETLRGSPSTHVVSLVDTLELGRALDKLPRRLIVYAVEGREFTAGAGVSEAVRAALPGVADSVLREAWRLRDEAARSSSAG